MVGQIVHKLVIQALEEFIASCEKKVAALEKKIYSSPLDDLLKVQKEFSDLLTSGQDRFTPEFLSKVRALEIRDKKARKAIQSRTSEGVNRYITQKVELVVAMDEVRNILWNEDFKQRLRNKGK